MVKTLPFADPHLNVESDMIRLGMLTYRGVVKDSMGRKRKILFTCDCGRVVVVPLPSLSIYNKGNCSDKKISGLPWSCGECRVKDFKPSYKPWGMKSSRNGKGQHNRIGRSVQIRKQHRESKCAKELHRSEWFCWQQAKRLGKGVCAKWQYFRAFYADMGDRPPGHVIAKKDPKKKHSPSNSYWKPVQQFLWGDTVVMAQWVTKEFGIPRTYLISCKKAGILDVQTVIALYQSGQRPEKFAQESRNA